MAARRALFASPPARPAPPPGAVHPLAVLAVAMLAPAIAWAHERWIPHGLRFPVDQSYFQEMTGEVLLFSIAATIAVFGLVVLWYLSAPGIVDALTPVTASAKAREAQRGALSRTLRRFLRVVLDGETDSPFMKKGLVVATFVFGRLPAFVLGLGAVQGWLVMPSFPLEGPLALPLRIASAVLAVWVLTGLFWRALGGVFILVFVYLCFAYGIVAIDAIPVLASAFFYLFSPKDRSAGVTSRQLMWMRLSLGLGFFLLGLINKIYIHDVFIGVADQHPAIIAGPQEMFPGLTRETWCFTTALGEMVFGLMMLIGIFNRVTTLLLTFVFGNFMLVFGTAEIVHVYPIAGFLLLFFRGSAGTSLDGLVFRANVRFWRWLRSSSSRIVYGSAVTAVAASASGILMFAPLVTTVEVMPALLGDGVGRNYRRPPPLPPASKWPPLDGSATPVALKPHADHKPRHGGVVTMSGDQHVEIVVRRDGFIQLFVSDAVRAPIATRDVRGTIKLERLGFSKLLTLNPDPSGALTASGPPPAIATTYTYSLSIRGAGASMSLSVPPGGTDQIQRF